ncbi:unnamed protein product [Adineta steineri]|uniref:Uncharacterized protein n=1 Tax=Adineta steineri TaxID=433720 RepID=A0A814J2H2_9BILA|nr:unnamed protein product [Adineta steineri]CAF1031360.1 unnamed protein product [Adineta steineri]
MKSVLITGANRSIGYGLELFDLAKEHSATIVPLQLDITDHTSIQKAVEQVEQRLNGNDLNYLINNAGTTAKLRFSNINETDMMETYRPNVIESWKATKIFLPLLEEYALHLQQRDIKQSSRNKTDQHLSTGCLQLSGLSIRGHAMLSHEGLPPERETFEYTWQMEIILDSIDRNLIEVENAVNVQIAPIRLCLCMCNMHTSLCNESLTLKVGTIQIRQLLRLYPGPWLETGTISVLELRINAKFECHPPTLANINQQLEFLRQHDLHFQRSYFLYNPKSQQTLNISTILINSNILSCACLGGPTNYYTLIQAEEFLKSSFRLSEQSSFDLSSSSSQTPGSDDYLSPNGHLSLTGASQTSLNSTSNNTNNIMESSSMHSNLNLFLTPIGNKQNLSTNSSR